MRLESPAQSSGAADLPGEIWAEILRVGVRDGVLNFRDICSISIAGRTLNRLGTVSSLWKLLFEKDFPQLSQNGVVFFNPVSAGSSLNFRTIYKQRFERIKASRIAAHKRQVLRFQSRGVVLEKECKDLEEQLHSEKKKLLAIQSELRGLEQARKSSVALRLWQPQVVHLMHQQVVEQQPVDMQFLQHSLDMEAKVCMEGIKRCNTSIAQKRSLIEKTAKELDSMTYNPVQDLFEHNSQGKPVKKSRVEKTKS